MIGKWFISDAFELEVTNITCSFCWFFEFIGQLPLDGILWRTCETRKSPDQMDSENTGGLRRAVRVIRFWYEIGLRLENKAELRCEHREMLLFSFLCLLWSSADRKSCKTFPDCFNKSFQSSLFSYNCTTFKKKKKLWIIRHLYGQNSKITIGHRFKLPSPRFTGLESNYSVTSENHLFSSNLAKNKS